MNQWVPYLVGSTILAAIAFVVVAVLWLKKLRETLATTLGETASQHIRSAQRHAETLAQLHRRQEATEQRIQTLTEAAILMRQEINALTLRKASKEEEAEKRAATQSRLLH